MRLIRFIFPLLLAFMVVNAGAMEAPMTEKWSSHMVGGANSIQTLDLDRTGPRIYAITYESFRARIMVFSLSGEPAGDFVIEPKMRYLYPTEGIKIAYLCDIGDDGVLDSIAGSETHTGSINKHILYRMERRYDEGLKQYDMYLNWKYEGSDLTTSIGYFDFNGSGMRELVTADRDGKISVFDINEGVPKRNFSLGAAIWGIQPFRVNESDVYFAVAMFRKLEVSGWGDAVWSFEVPTRFNAAYVSDVDNDGKVEVFGSTDDTLYLFNGSGFPRWSHRFDSIEAVEVMRIALGNYSRLVVASKNSLFFLDGAGTVTGSFEVGEKVLSLRPLAYREENALVVGTENGVKFYTFDVSDFRRNEARDAENEAYKSFERGDFNATFASAMRAAGLYEGLGDSEGSGRMASLGENASDILEALGLYEKARIQFLESDYENSTLNARNAAEIFEKTGHIEGAQRSRILISGAIDKKKADDLYNAAELSYLKNRLEDVFENASIALGIYEKLNISDGAERARALLYVASANVNKTRTTQTTLRVTQTTAARPSPTRSREDLILYATLVMGVLVILYMAYKSRRR